METIFQEECQTATHYFSLLVVEKVPNGKSLHSVHIPTYCRCCTSRIECNGAHVIYPPHPRTVCVKRNLELTQ